MCLLGASKGTVFLTLMICLWSAESALCVGVFGWGRVCLYLWRLSSASALAGPGTKESGNLLSSNPGGTCKSPGSHSPPELVIVSSLLAVF